MAPECLTIDDVLDLYAQHTGPLWWGIGLRDCGALKSVVANGCPDKPALAAAGGLGVLHFS